MKDSGLTEKSLVFGDDLIIKNKALVAKVLTVEQIAE